MNTVDMKSGKLKVNMNIKKILDDHNLWLETNGQDGRRAILNKTVLRRIDLSGSNLSRAVLCNVDLSRAILRGVNLSGSNLSGANLSGSNLSGANLSGSNLSGANLSGSDLSVANLSGSDLSGANLSGSNLSGANLIGSDLRLCILPNSTLLLPRYHVVWWKNQLAIGCQQHSIELWQSFSDDDIKKMDKKALDWWKKWKKVIFDAIRCGGD